MTSTRSDCPGGGQIRNALDVVRATVASRNGGATNQS